MSGIIEARHVLLSKPRDAEFGSPAAACPHRISNTAHRSTAACVAVPLVPSQSHTSFRNPPLASLKSVRTNRSKPGCPSSNSSASVCGPPANETEKQKRTRCIQPQACEPTLDACTVVIFRLLAFYSGVHVSACRAYTCYSTCLLPFPRNLLICEHECTPVQPPQHPFTHYVAPTRIITTSWLPPDGYTAISLLLCARQFKRHSSP